MQGVCATPIHAIPKHRLHLCEKKVKNNDNDPVLETRGSDFNFWDLQNEVFVVPIIFSEGKVGI